MKSLLILAIIQISCLSLAQTNAHLPLKSFSFDFVSVNVFNETDSIFNESGQFTGVGEIQIYSDSITVTWSNQWECGTYRLFIDTANYQKMEYEDRLEWLSVYKVRSKGYHTVDGWLTLVEGSNIKDGSYTHIIYDTNFTPEGWARKRRFYPDLVEIK